MANNHQQFIDFKSSIESSNRQRLKDNRDAIRRRIKDYFKNNLPGEIQPKFHQQGSYAMYTILNPIKDEDGLGCYDLDDGVYFIGKSEEDRKSIDWYHDKVLKAVFSHTSTGAEDKSPCVRVNYADGHHVDLPIYFMKEGDEHPQLAHKSKGWIDSDPREFYKWFNNQCSNRPQLRRIVMYLKAWADFMNTQSVKMPSGCILTMLAVEHFSPKERDDMALKDVLLAMYRTLSQVGGFHCYRPTFPKKEDLFKNYSDTRKDNFLKKLKSFSEDSERAINSSNPREACLKWHKYFDDRFSCSTAKDVDEDAQRVGFSGTITGNSRFA